MRSTFQTGIKSAALLAVMASLFTGVSGCSFLKPTESTARHFVLTPVSATGSATVTPGSIAVGLGQVKIPAYLFNTSLAVRTGTNEIEYLPSTFWAERLDSGFQRVLAANLAILLPTDRVPLSAWRRDEVVAEVYVTLEQFDVDATGRGVLVARWRILSPGGDKDLKAGSSRLSRQGPPPDPGVSGSIGTLSELVAEFAGQLASALRETTSGPRAAVGSENSIAGPNVRTRVSNEQSARRAESEYRLGGRLELERAPAKVGVATCEYRRGQAVFQAGDPLHLGGPALQRRRTKDTRTPKRTPSES